MKISEDLLKNDVPAVGQLADNDCVSFCLAENADIKVLLLGNSITRHGKAENLGWYGDWGMAASCAEKDYVHTLVRLLQQGGKRVSYCTANMSEWERERNESLLQTRYAAAKAFGADITVVRLGENARLLEDFDGFCACYARMVQYFAAERTVLTDLFWEYPPFDGFVQRLAADKGYAFAALHDLGARSDMKATGKFAHAGVAAHPGDNGMEEIANRIYAAIAKDCG
ncbi:MAG: hypothetical protein K2L51_02930 [Clostridiales bacterium]|nr:hypothetical protein [Clostridiales bacterium]